MDIYPNAIRVYYFYHLKRKRVCIIRDTVAAASAAAAAAADDDEADDVRGHGDDVGESGEMALLWPVIIPLHLTGSYYRLANVSIYSRTIVAPFLSR